MGWWGNWYIAGVKRELIKISPFNSRMVIALELAFHYHVPSGDDFITLMIDLDIEAYKKDINIHRSDDAQEVYLNLTDRKTRIIENDGKQIQLELMKSDIEDFKGKDFRFYEILVSVPES